MDGEEEKWHDVCDILTGCEFTLMQWQTLLRKLGLKSGIIKSIVRDHERDGLKEMAHIGFRRWRVARGGAVESCCGNLCRELRKQHLTLIAEKIENFIKLSKEENKETKLLAPLETTPKMPRRNSNVSTSTTELQQQGRSTLNYTPRAETVVENYCSCAPCVPEPIPEYCDLVNDIVNIHPKFEVGFFSHYDHLPFPDAETLRWPCDVTVMRNGRVVVCDFNNDCLYVFAPVVGANEKCLFEIERAITHLGKLRQPIRVATWRDYLYVCLESQRSILVYSFAGTFLAEIHVQFNVTCIHVKDDVLYVGGKGQVVPYLIRGPNRVELAFNVIYRLDSQYLSCAYMAATRAGGLMVVTEGSDSDYEKFYFWQPVIPQPCFSVDLKAPRGIAVDANNSVLMLQNSKNGQQELWRIPLGDDGAPVWKARSSAISVNDRYLRANSMETAGSDLLILTAPTSRAVFIYQRT